MPRRWSNEEVEVLVEMSQIITMTRLKSRFFHFVNFRNSWRIWKRKVWRQLVIGQ